MGHGTADERDVLRPSKPQIRYKLAAPAHEPVIFFTQKTRTNALACHSTLLPNKRHSIILNLERPLAQTFRGEHMASDLRELREPMSRVNPHARPRLFSRRPYDI
jgi:hypothetical protein